MGNSMYISWLQFELSPFGHIICETEGTLADIYTGTLTDPRHFSLEGDEGAINWNVAIYRNYPVGNQRKLSLKSINHVTRKESDFFNILFHNIVLRNILMGKNLYIE